MDSISLYINESIATTLWEDLLADSATASFFQSPSCYALYARQDFMEPFVLATGRGERYEALVCGYVVQEGKGLKGFFSRRAIVPGGLLIRHGADSEVVGVLLERLRELLKERCIYAEIRNYYDYSHYRTVFEAKGFAYEPHLNIQTDCGDREAVVARMSESKRRQLRRSLQAGMIAEPARSKEDIAAFYTLLHRLYQEKIGRPVFPQSFFESLLTRDDVKVLVVRYQGNIRGGIVCGICAQDRVYEWFVCGDDSLDRVYPSVVATWAGIDFAMEQGCKVFDFMGAGKPGIHYGVRDFKLRFGGKLVEYGRFKFIFNSSLYEIGNKFITIVNKFKLQNKSWQTIKERFSEF